MLSWKMFQQVEHVCRVVRQNQRPCIHAILKNVWASRTCL